MQAGCVGLQAGCRGVQAAGGCKLDAWGCRLDAWGCRREVAHHALAVPRDREGELAARRDEAALEHGREQLLVELDLGVAVEGEEERPPQPPAAARVQHDRAQVVALRLVPGVGEG